MKRALLLTFSALLVSYHLSAQYSTEIEMREGEYWWGGLVDHGTRMPYVKPVAEIDLMAQGNMVMPLLLSSKGRYVWSDRPFRFSVGERRITVESDFEKLHAVNAGNTLGDAYRAACGRHFPPSGKIPERLFFARPQYNTWIELMYDQNQEDILAYSKGIVDNGFPAGVLMIDDNWQKYYGNFDFKPEKFPDPRAMVDQLHARGFRVMLWICPFVSPDSPEYRFANSKGYLIKDATTGGPAIFSWWNGQSACYDLTNPAAAEYFISVLKQTQEKYGVDGFKFDAGDIRDYLKPDLVAYRREALPSDHTLEWMKTGLEFPFNEYRAGWKMTGQGLVFRLSDKNYSWAALGTLIPEMTTAGLLGFSYTCPDMIGGGQFTSFLDIDPDRFDQALIVRSAQVHTLMPMMQFSVAPWRVLSEENLAIVKAMAELHTRMGDYILECARESSLTGEPIVRHMEFAFPDQGFATCGDQFMLGEKYMVAPVVTPENRRTVKLPRGVWRDDRGETHRGGRSIEIEVPLSRLPWFEKME